MTLHPLALQHFYPRSPCGERLTCASQTIKGDTFLSTLSLRRATFACAGWFQVVYYFYPRSPCGERRRVDLCLCAMYNYFYPRSPCGERRRKGSRRCVLSGISIHALLAESDIISQADGSTTIPFLSTLSLRRATGLANKLKTPCVISIHALLAESD